MDVGLQFVTNSMWYLVAIGATIFGEFFLGIFVNDIFLNMHHWIQDNMWWLIRPVYIDGEVIAIGMCVYYFYFKTRSLAFYVLFVTCVTFIISHLATLLFRDPMPLFLDNELPANGFCQWAMGIPTSVMSVVSSSLTFYYNFDASVLGANGSMYLQIGLISYNILYGI